MAHRQQAGALSKSLALLCILVALTMVIFGLALAALSTRGVHLIPSVICVGAGVFLALLMLPELLSLGWPGECQQGDPAAAPSLAADALSPSTSQCSPSSCDVPRRSAVLIPFPTRSKKSP